METKLSVKAIRSNLNFTQVEMVEALKSYGITMSLVTYSKKENGEVDFTWKEIKAISKMSNIQANLID